MQKSVRRALSAICFAILFVTLPAMSGGNPSNRQVDVIQTSRGPLRLMPVYHGSVMLEFGGKIIHVDPWSQGDFTDLPPADLIVITHTHADHLDRTMVDKLHKPETIIVGPPAVIALLQK
ncbi:MAG TPA: MBL fold metallo-hydrolase [Candidatus Acidoferrales bacterium]|nr:MBL fold metallo-hydrolase [Candidatus Acidoferrales bacterium]